MANSSVSFNFQFFSKCFSTGMNNTGKKTVQCMSTLDKPGEILTLV